MREDESPWKLHRLAFLAWMIFVGVCAGFLLSYTAGHSGGEAAMLEEASARANSGYEVALVSLQERQVQDDLANAERTGIARHDARRAVQISLKNWERIIDARGRPVEQTHETWTVKNP